jgi:hypothetical protein
MLPSGEQAQEYNKLPPKTLKVVEEAASDDESSLEEDSMASDGALSTLPQGATVGLARPVATSLSERLMPPSRCNPPSDGQLGPFVAGVAAGLGSADPLPAGVVVAPPPEPLGGDVAEVGRAPRVKRGIPWGLFLF